MCQQLPNCWILTVGRRFIVVMWFQYWHAVFLFQSKYFMPRKMHRICLRGMSELLPELQICTATTSVWFHFHSIGRSSKLWFRSRSNLLPEKWFRSRSNLILLRTIPIPIKSFPNPKVLVILRTKLAKKLKLSKLWQSIVKENVFKGGS